MADSVDGLSDDHLKEIGRVAVEWSRLEATVEIMIWSMLFVDCQWPSPWFREREGRAITTHVNLLLQLDMLLSLTNTKFDVPDYQIPRYSTVTGKIASLPEGMNAFVAEIRKLSSKRNAVVHAVWAPISSEKALQQSYRARGKLTPLFELRTPTAIRTVSEEIAALNRYLTLFHENVLLPYLRSPPPTLP